MQDLRYTPDLMARSLRAGTDATIGLVVESIADPFFSELVAAVESATYDDGKSVLVASHHGDADRERRIVEQMLERRVSGLLIVPTGGDHSWLSRRSAPLVLVDRPARGLRRRRRRHRRPAGGVRRGGSPDRARTPRHRLRRRLPHVATSAARLAGYREAMATHGLAGARRPRPRELPDLAGSARRDRARCSTGERPPTAVLSAATRCSLGVVPALHEHRRTDVALVGFGDFAMADMLVPAITVVDHSPVAVGLAAAARLHRADLPSPS